MEAQQPTQYQSVSTGGGFDAKSIIALNDSRKEIAEFILGLNGLKVVVENKFYKTIRYKKPLFTSEYTQELFENIFIQINKVSMRSTFNENEIRSYNMNFGEDLARDLAIHGMKNIVSNNVWEKWLQLAGNDKFCEENNIQWSYNDDFKADYMNLAKKEFNIHNESFGQSISLKMVWDAIMYFIHSGRNKSLNALSLNFEREIVRESHTSSASDNEGRREGRIMSFLRGIGGK